MDENSEKNVGAAGETGHIEHTAVARTTVLPETREDEASAGAADEKPLRGWHRLFRSVTGMSEERTAAGMTELLASSRKHRAFVAGIAVLAVIAVAALVMAGVRAFDVPSSNVIEADARSRVSTPDYSAGDFGSTAEMYLSSVSAGATKRDVRTSDSSSAQFGASGYASTQVTAHFSNGSVTATKTVKLSYAKLSGSWIGIGSESDASVSYEATAGVDTSRVVNNVQVLLEKGESATAGSTGSTAGAADGNAQTLAEIYDGAKVTLESESFDADAQTDVVELTLTKASTFTSYSCKLTAHFAFRPVNGMWELTSVEVSNDAKTLSMEPLVGTWTGTFKSQSTEGTKCLGASEAGLTVNISSATGATDGSGTGAKLAGTVSCLAHFHEHPARDASSMSGDSQLTDVSLSATQVASSSDKDGTLVFTADLPETVGGTVSVRLTFGGEDADSATAQVTTSYPHTGWTLFIPYDETLTYEDTFTLTKVK